MNKYLKAFALVAAAVATVSVGLLWNDGVSNGSRTGWVTEAHAIIGRPLTPVSFAGVARRTVRRCAVGVYSC